MNPDDRLDALTRHHEPLPKPSGSDATNAEIPPMTPERRELMAAYLRQTFEDPSEGVISPLRVAWASEMSWEYGALELEDFAGDLLAFAKHAVPDPDEAGPDAFRVSLEASAMVGIILRVLEHQRAEYDQLDREAEEMGVDEAERRYDARLKRRLDSVVRRYGRGHQGRARKTLPLHVRQRRAAGCRPLGRRPRAAASRGATRAGPDDDPGEPPPAHRRHPIHVGCGLPHADAASPERAI